MNFEFTNCEKESQRDVNETNILHLKQTAALTRIMSFGWN